MVCFYLLICAWRQLRQASAPPRPRKDKAVENRISDVRDEIEIKHFVYLYNEITLLIITVHLLGMITLTYLN